MVYKKRSYKKSSKKSAQLSTRRIFSNRSSRSQALQIYRLNRKLNYYAKRNRPEIRVKQAQPFDKTFSSQSISNVWTSWVPPYPTQGVGDDSRSGDYVKPISLTSYHSIEYYNTSTTGYHNSESAGCTVRFILYQFKNQLDTANAAISNLNELFPYASYSGSGYTMLANCPFINGISERIQILADRRVVLTTSNNQKNVKITIKPKPLRFSASGNLHNQVFGAIVVSGLHYDSDYTEYCTVSTMSKLVFTDA